MRQHKMGTPTVVGKHVGPGGRRRGQNNRHMGGCPYGVSRVVEGGAATLKNGKVWTEYIVRIIVTPAHWRVPSGGPAPRPAGDADGLARGATSQSLGAATRRHTRD